MLQIITADCAQQCFVCGISVISGRNVRCQEATVRESTFDEHVESQMGRYWAAAIRQRC